MSLITNCFTVSTDVGGIKLNDFNSVIQLYEGAGFPKPLLEVVPFPLSKMLLVGLTGNLAHPEPIVAGIHGQLGATKTPQEHRNGLMDWLKIKTANGVFPSLEDLNQIPELLGSFQKRPVYLNIHTEEASARLPTYIEHFKGKENCYLAIENGLAGDPVQVVVDSVERAVQEGNINTIGTYDVVHSIIVEAGDVSIGSVKKSWDKVLKRIDPKIFKQIHLPIGLNMKDSLPVNDMSISMFKQLGVIIKAGKLNVVLENQHGYFGADFDKEKERLKPIADMFKAAGIF